MLNFNKSAIISQPLDFIPQDPRLIKQLIRVKEEEKYPKTNFK